MQVSQPAFLTHLSETDLGRKLQEDERVHGRGTIELKSRSIRGLARRHRRFPTVLLGRDFWRSLLRLRWCLWLITAAVLGPLEHRPRSNHPLWHLVRVSVQWWGVFKGDWIHLPWHVSEQLHPILRNSLPQTRIEGIIDYLMKHYLL